MNFDGEVLNQAAGGQDCAQEPEQVQNETGASLSLTMEGDKIFQHVQGAMELELQGESELSIVLEPIDTPEWTNNNGQEVALAEGVLPDGCLLYQCDDKTYRISYPGSLEAGKSQSHSKSESQHVDQVQGSATKNSSETSEEFLCSMPGCAKKFSSLNYLKIHQLCHAGETKKPLECSFAGCDRKFSWPAHLKYHMLTHEGKRSFKCDHCGKTFYTSQRLRVHTRSHTGERPYVCQHEGCGKAFITAGNLKNHSRIHSGEKPFVCDVENCKKAFSESSSLKKHKIIHTGKKEFKCEICGQEYTQSGSRNHHMRKAHSNTSVPVPIYIFNVDEQAVQHTKQEYVVVTDDAHDAPTNMKEESVTSTNPSYPVQSNKQITAAASANVVVLTEPEEMVAITSNFHGDSVKEEIVYNSPLSCD